MSATLRQLYAGLRLLAVMTVVLGVVYPLGIFVVGRVIPDRADGSLVRVDGEVVGSALIGQEFVGDQWFQSRPSAGGYDTTASGASNLGPNEADLIADVTRRRAQIAAREGIELADVPADAVTASASGLDPDISPAYARIQVERVARSRDLSVETVQELVELHIAGRGLGFLGEPHVNVLELNVALAELG